MSRSDQILLHSVLIALSAILGAGIAYKLGQDVNFDQLNYHTYVAHAFWTNRGDRDVAPAQLLHSFVSPIVYLPFYSMVIHFPPRMVGMTLGAIHGINLWLVAVFAWFVTPTLACKERIATVAAATVISAASPAAISEVGTTFPDLLTSIPVLGGLALLLRADFRPGRTVSTSVRIGLAGALVGAAVSLKLTNASFAIGLAAAAAVGWKSWSERLAAIAATGAGGCLGFALCGGFWYLRMWQRFGNPFFPYYNAVFRLPDYPAISVVDDRFHPALRHILTYPFRWALGGWSTTELPLRDIRFAVLMVAGLAALGVWAARRSDARARRGPAGRRLAVFFIVAFCIWMYEWSAQRYIVVLELLLGPTMVLVLQWCRLGGLGRGFLLPGLTSLLAIACAATVIAPNWGRIPWADTWYSINIPKEIGDRPIAFLDGEPLSYLVLALPQASTAVEVTAYENLSAMGDNEFLRRIRNVLADPRNEALVAVAVGPLSDNFKETVARYGLKQDGACVTTAGRPSPLNWCPLKRANPDH